MKQYIQNTGKVGKKKEVVGVGQGEGRESREKEELEEASS